MDFHTLSRKQLQALCKKNKIPANVTNVAMADALTAVNQVEGLDEFLNPIEGDAGTGTPIVNHRTACRTSSQRKTAKEEVEEGSKVKVSVSARPKRGFRAEGVVEQENKDAHVPPVTPAGNRRRVNAVSTRRKKEAEMVEEDGDKNGVQGKLANVPITPAAAPVSRRRATGRSVCTTKIETPGGTSVQRTHNTRRSVRLLEKDLSKMSLMDTEDTGLVNMIHDVSQDLSNISDQVEDLSDAEMGASSQTASAVVSENTQELKVSSIEKNTEYECQSYDSGSDVKLVCVLENDMVVEQHGSNEAEPEKVNYMELEAEPHGSNEAGFESLPVVEESCDSSELIIENKGCFGARQDTLPVEASKDAITEVTGQDIAAVTVVEPEDVSVDVTDQDVAGSLPMLAECNMDDHVSTEGDYKEDKNNDQDVTDQEVNDAPVSLNESVECGMDDDKEDKNNEPQVEAESNYSNLKLEGSSDTCDKFDDAGSFEASEDALKQVTDQDTATLIVVVPDDISDLDVAGSLPMSPVNDAPENIKDLLTGSEGVHVLESIFHSSGEHQEEELEAKPEQLEAETEKIGDAPDATGTSSVILVIQKDFSCENSGAVIDVCTESSVESITAESSFSDVKAEYQKSTYENFEADAQPEESEEPVAGEDIVLKADNAFSSVLHVEAEEHKNTSENLEAEAQADESEEPVAGEDSLLEAVNAFSSVPDGMCSPQIPLVHEQVSVQSAGSYIDSCPSEDTAIPNQELHVSSETMTHDSIHEQKSTDILGQSVVTDDLKGDVDNTNRVKENVTSDELNKMTIGELRRMLKEFSLDGKSNINGKEVGKKRTALQVLPQNQNTAGEAQIDG